MSESDLSDGDGSPASAAPVSSKGHSKGDNKLNKIIKRLVFGTLLLFILIGIIAAGHLWTLFFVRQL